MIYIKKHSDLSIILLGILLLVTFSNGKAQNVQEYVKADSLKIGDTFSYIITLNKDRTYDEVLFPDSTQFGSSFEIRSKQQFKATNFKDSLVYQLQFFGGEDTTIPKLPVKLVQSSDTTVAYTSPVPIHFKSVLENKDEQLRPLKPIFDFAAEWWPYIVAFILLVVACWYLYEQYKKKSAEPKPPPKAEFTPTPFVDPLKQLSDMLQQLKSYTFSSREDYKQFYINLGDAIRLYFESLYRIPALESTSGELMRELYRRTIDERLMEHTRRVLNEADMVKFAKFTPTEQQAQTALSKADDFLKRAREIDRPRIDHMRRKHFASVEQQRQQFQQNDNKQTVEEHI